MPVPSSLALTNIADGAQIIAADHRNNYAAIQTAVNALIGFFGSGVTGSTLRFNGTDWVRTSNILLDDTNSKITVNRVDSNSAGTVASGGAVFRALALGSVNAFPLVCIVSGEANERFNISIDASGFPKLNFGAGGTSSPDLNLFRAGVSQGKSDHNWQFVDGAATKVKAGAPVDGDFITTPPVGTLVVDTTNNKIWARTAAATWKGAVIA